MRVRQEFCCLDVVVAIVVVRKMKRSDICAIFLFPYSASDTAWLLFDFMGAAFCKVRRRDKRTSCAMRSKLERYAGWYHSSVS